MDYLRGRRIRQSAVAMILETVFRVELIGNQFRVIDAGGEEMGTYPTEDAARQVLERCEKDAAMLSTAELLVNIAVKTHMLTHGVDRETALRWVRCASEMA
jgi:hypothetical protein